MLRFSRFYMNGKCEHREPFGIRRIGTSERKKTDDNEPVNKTESLNTNPENQNLGCQDLFAKNSGPINLISKIW